MTGRNRDGEPLSIDEYVTRANAICQTYFIDRRPQQPSSIDDMVGYLDETIPDTRDAVKELRKLTPPKTHEETVRQWMLILDIAVKSLEEIKDTLENGNVSEGTELLGRFRAVEDRVNQLARDIGADTCAE
jgi:hypothetical protein